MLRCHHSCAQNSASGTTQEPLPSRSSFLPSNPSIGPDGGAISKTGASPSSFAPIANVEPGGALNLSGVISISPTNGDIVEQGLVFAMTAILKFSTLRLCVWPRYRPARRCSSSANDWSPLGADQGT